MKWFQLSFIFLTMIWVNLVKAVDTNNSKIIAREYASMSKTSDKIKLNHFDKQIAQRLMISLRYFCDDVKVSHEKCDKPMRELSSSLSDFISETNLGGIVLFSENLESPEQIRNLTYDMQTAASLSSSKMPLFIGIDQEGGRVVRLERSMSTAFSGNMAIGATYQNHKTHYATMVGKIIGKELASLGINLNFSPTIDVTSNPDNPVINVRSFGEAPKMVAELGMAMTDGLQSENVIATLKHFPGHGNTNIDSHTGLPRVNSDRTSVYKNDLYPFKKIIETSNPGMVMTAHIEFPQLDGSKIDSLTGKQILKPATMSKKILTDLLRKEMGFEGIVITDALNMGSITEHFSPEKATALSLLAGADIALMPFRISKPEDINKFKEFVKDVAKLIRRSEEGVDRVNNSIKRILSLKDKYKISDRQNDKRLQEEKKYLHTEESRHLEMELALESITLLKNNQTRLPLNPRSTEKIHFIFQDENQSDLVINLVEKRIKQAGLNRANIVSSIITNENEKAIEDKIVGSDINILFFSDKRESAVVRGEVDDLNLNLKVTSLKEQSRQLKARKESYLNLLKSASASDTKVILFAMQSPYEIRDFQQYSDAIVVAYDPSIYKKLDTQELTGETYSAAVSVLFGDQPFKGHLPVRMN